MKGIVKIVMLMVSMSLIIANVKLKVLLNIPLNINNAFCVTVEGLEEEIHTVLEGADEIGMFLIES